MTRNIVIVDTDNSFLKNIVKEYDQYLFTSNANYRKFSIIKDVCQTFGKSLGQYEDTISEISEFNSNTLFKQLDFYKKTYSDNEKTKKIALRYVITFYRWLVSENVDINIFANSPNMCENLLMSPRFLTLVMEDYYFVAFDINNMPKDYPKLCFVAKNVDRYSTTATKDCYACVDLSGLENSFYRELIVKYYLSKSKFAWYMGSKNETSFPNIMQILYKKKCDAKYPNQRLDFLTKAEGIFIRSYIKNIPKLKISSKNSVLWGIGEFLKYCNANKYIQVEDGFFEYFVKYANENTYNAEMVPDDDLVAINNYFLEKGKDDIFFREMRVIFHLLLQTEFRISQICHLKIGCIRPTIKPGAYELISTTKTSNGDTERFVITERTYNLLMDIIEETEPLRQQCPITSLKDYIFIYVKQTRFRVFSDYIFLNHMKNTCEKIGIKNYSSRNLRDTYMSKAYESIIRNGKSNVEMAVLSHHKNINTTKEYYIDTQLDDILEASYGITIGNICPDANERVVDTIPKECNTEENEVENGCGTCTAETCMIKDPLPCLLCSSFRTTPKHKIFFEKAIEDIDRLLKYANNDHDKEDLMTIKDLYLEYIKAIIEHEEIISSGDDRNERTVGA